MGSMRRRRVSDVLLVVVTIVAVVILAYPSVSDWWSVTRAGREISDYEALVGRLDGRVYDDEIFAARSFNERLATRGGGVVALDAAERTEYEGLLDLSPSGVMAYLVVPRLGLRVPVYHGTSDSVLQTGAGHLEGTSLPVGGPSTHAVISGHRGLSSARLFTNFDQLEAGDLFMVSVLREELWYEVDQIHVVEPDDLSELGIEAKEDLCTLVTCTPYGVNSHRLLVRGHRVDAPEDGVPPNVAEGGARLIDATSLGLLIAAAGLVILVIVVFIARRGRGRRT